GIQVPRRPPRVRKDAPRQPCVNPGSKGLTRALFAPSFQRNGLPTVVKKLFAKGPPMIKKLACAAVLAMTAFAVAPASAGKLQLGTLDCTIDGGTAYIVASNKGVSCVFRPHHHGPSEVYTGVISKVGL